MIDGDISDSVKVSARDLTVSEGGVYSITVQVSNSLGDTSSVKLPLTVISNPSAVPTVRLSTYLVFLEKGQSFDPMSFVSGVTEVSGSYGNTEAVTCSGSVDTNEEGTYNVTYSYTDSSGRTGSVILAVVVEGGSKA